MNEEKFNQLRQQAGHHFDRERRNALDILEEQLQTSNRNEALAILRERLEAETSPALRDRIYGILDDDTRSNPGPQKGTGDGKSVEVTCPHCYISSWYNRNEICQESSVVFLAPDQMGLVDVRIPCNNCGKTIIAKINCDIEDDRVPPSPIIGKKPDTDSPAERLSKQLDEIEKNQLEFLDQAGKRIIELSTGMLGILFAALAFGKDFPPPYFANNGLSKAAAILAGGFFFGALIAGFIAIYPRKYQRYVSNLTGQRSEMEKAEGWKYNWFRIGSIFFGVGILSLLVLIIRIVLMA